MSLMYYYCRSVHNSDVTNVLLLLKIFNFEFKALATFVRYRRVLLLDICSFEQLFG